MPSVENRCGLSRAIALRRSLIATKRRRAMHSLPAGTLSLRVWGRRWLAGEANHVIRRKWEKHCFQNSGQITKLINLWRPFFSLFFLELCVLAAAAAFDQFFEVCSFLIDLALLISLIQNLPTCVQITETNAQSAVVIHQREDPNFVSRFLCLFIFSQCERVP